tara:strand:- start:2425 stop:2628 length:204 start_codon:yes stop_codon:yes gene_type:complete
MPRLNKTWVRKEKIVDVGKCKYCNKSMTSEDSFIPIGKIIRNKYIYKNSHYDCVKENDAKPKTNFDW